MERNALMVKDILTNIYSAEVFCIFDDDKSRIVYEDQVKNIRDKGTSYDDWVVLDIETYQSDLTNGKGRNIGIMINAYNPAL